MVNIFNFCFINCLDPQLLEKLPKEKQHEFFRAVADGSLSQMIEIWTPWWNESNSNKPKIVDISNSNENILSQTPKIMEPIPCLKDLTPVTPSPLLQFNLLEVLYSYCFVARLFNGDIFVD